MKRNRLRSLWLWIVLVILGLRHVSQPRSLCLMILSVILAKKVSNIVFVVVRSSLNEDRVVDEIGCI